MREVIHAVQSQRKTLDLEFTDRIELGFATESEELRNALQAHAETLASETLAVSISFELLQNAELETLDVDGRALTMSLKRARPPETS